MKKLPFYCNDYYHLLPSEAMARRVVWITGASSGIGEHMAYCLAKGGARLVLSARREEELARVKAKCLSLGRLDSLLALL